MAENILGLTVSDVEERLNMLSLPGLVSVGSSDSDIPTARIEAVIAQITDKVVSSAPEGYRRLFRRIEGERCVVDALEGQIGLYLFGTRFDPTGVVEISNLPAGAVVYGVDLYIDYGLGRARSGGASSLPLANGPGDGGYSGFGSFGSASYRLYTARSRGDRLSESRYTVTPETGAVTLSKTIGLDTTTYPLRAGQTVHADYFHTATAHCPYLRLMALDMIAAKLREDLPYRGDKFQEAERMAQQATAQFLDFKEGNVGIDMFDQLDLVDETRAFKATARRPRTGGW